jgi:hypothetical protein
MQPYEPFSGVLLMPDRAVFARTSAVTLLTGEPVALISWHAWTARARFEIRDATGAVELARGGREGILGRRYVVCGPDGETLLGLKLSAWGPGGRSTVTLPGGRTLNTKGNWSNRKFSVADAAGRPVARIVTTGGPFALRPDSFAFELQAPVLSAIQAVGLAQCMRAAVEAERGTSAGLVGLAGAGG